MGKRIWEHRFEDINNFEQYLTRNGIVVLKFFLNVGKEEQRQRFLARLDLPEKNWKFSLADAHERQHWAEYQDAYDDMIQHTATRTRRGTSCLPTTSGSPVWPSPQPSSDGCRN